jgi:hypothetical protein
LPDISWFIIPKREKIYQFTTNAYTKCPKIYLHLPFQDPEIFTQIWIFLAKTYQNGGKKYRIAGKYTQYPENIPNLLNRHKIYLHFPRP